MLVCPVPRKALSPFLLLIEFAQSKDTILQEDIFPMDQDWKEPLTLDHLGDWKDYVTLDRLVATFISDRQQDELRPWSHAVDIFERPRVERK